MPTRARRGDLAADDARRISRHLADELREARLNAGVSQATAARAAGMSPSQLGRLERCAIAHPSLDQLCRAARAMGLTASVKLYPVGSPVRDAAQLSLLARFERRLASALHLRREVPLPIQGDLRAWDGCVEGGGDPFFVEGESHIRDARALARRIGLKVRDDPRAELVVLVATRSEHNRRVIAEHREAFRSLFSLDGGPVLRALAAGRRPSAGGIVLL